jgi:hypothetical protein
MKSQFGVALLSATAIVASAPAQAAGTLTRSFVSSAGVDSNPCTIAAPCASFAAAYNAVQANGIIAALDPGRYGPLTISYPVTVNGNGWSAITAPAHGNGIAINAGSGNVVLIGLEIDGAGAAYNGIVFNTGSSLTISNCVVKDFVTNINGQVGASGNGILIAPTSGPINFTIVNTIAVNNAQAGIYYLPSNSVTAIGAIDHVVASNNSGEGIDFDLSSATGGSAAVGISNSVVSHNVDGIIVDAINFASVTRNNSGAPAVGPPAQPFVSLTIDDDEISNNNGNGIAIGSGLGTVLLSRSVITKNLATGVLNGATVYTYGDNRIYANGNNNAVLGVPLTPVTAQ